MRIVLLVVLGLVILGFSSSDAVVTSEAVRSGLETTTAPPMAFSPLVNDYD
jgi:hypothetical protein